ncbi:Fe2+-enterobactin ABC transporter substrate-binding protein [Rothia kristinae]|uniref:Fe2+-enterobactin ABC transporter substrate-binding protein n=1 Tax=Rothia kristinae TaxID=37923 RepID=UPI0020B69C92|nr:Fe2+-enterobactin ABC transporter substrate-binding protein [Rothia kristinae]
MCGVFALSACGSSGDGGSEDSSDSASASGSSGDWPRTVEDDNGDEVTIDSQPENIVSTSVTLTGSLLAADAPVKATGITQANSPLADDKGFFTQWGDVAEERGVKALSGITTKPEEVAAEDPDLIIVSKTGQDSAMEQLDQLKEIGAPVFVVDYADKDWQDVTEKLGEVTGHEQQAEDVVKKYEDKLAEVKDAIELPEQPTTALNYNPSRDGSGSKANIWTDKSAQGRMLEELGFELTTVPDDAKSTSSQMGQRDDIVPVDSENLSKAITGKTAVIFNANDQKVQAFEKDQLVADTDAVKEDRVYAMGLDSFRLDYYSAGNVLDIIKKDFGK